MDQLICTDPVSWFDLCCGAVTDVRRHARYQHSHRTQNAILIDISHDSKRHATTEFINAVVSYPTRCPAKNALALFQYQYISHPQRPPPHAQPKTSLPSLQIALQAPTAALPKAIPKADTDGQKQADTEQRRAPLIMVRDGSPLSDLAHTPEIQTRAVHERDARDRRKRPRRREGEAVAEIEQRGGNAADEDAEFEPREEGAFGGELDFGFDADGHVDACVGC